MLRTGWYITEGVTAAKRASHAVLDEAIFIMLEPCMRGFKFLLHDGIYLFNVVGATASSLGSMTMRTTLSSLIW